MAKDSASTGKFAVIETGGKQYLVSPQDRIKIEKLPGEPREEVVFEKVLLVTGADKADESARYEIGKPYVAGAKVAGKILKQGRGRKIRIFKYKPKVRYRRRKGHRQEFTEVEIVEIKNGMGAKGLRG